MAMDTFIELNLLFSVTALSYFWLSMKYFLHKNGYKVNWFLDFGRDFRTLQRMGNSEAPASLRKKSARIMFGLKISAGYLILTALIGVFKHMLNGI